MQDHIDVANQAWQEVFSRSIDADRQAITGLREWLARQPNAHAAMLSGSPKAGNADEQSARDLEALLLGRIATKELSRTTAAQHLYLLHRVGKRLRQQQLPLAPTRVAAILRPPPSPFPRDTARAIARVEAWRRALNDILSQPLPQDASSLWALTALSVICNGALLDRGKLFRLRLMLERNCLRIERTDNGHGFVDFLLPFEGLGNHHLQRWWCDPVSDLLLDQFPGTGALCAAGATVKVIREVLGRAGVAERLWPRRLTDLLKSANTWWALRCAPVDLHAMTRTFVSHNLTARCWSRLLDRPALPEPAALPIRGHAAPAATAEPAEAMSAEKEIWLAATAEHEWLDNLCSRLDSTDLPSARQYASDLLQGTHADDYRRPYLAWLCSALAVPSRNNKISVGLKVLADPFLQAAPRLLSYFGSKDISRLHVSELDEAYRAILDACEPGDPVFRIARGLRLLHDYLVRTHKVNALPDERETFGEDGALMPVDATVVSIDEYLAAHDWLERQLQFGADPIETQTSQVVLILTFRCGLRRGEVFGLRVCDVHDRRGIYLHVRSYPGHRLKTPNSTRTIRIDPLLDSNSPTNPVLARLSATGQHLS